MLYYRLKNPFEGGGGAEAYFYEVAEGVFKYAGEKKALLRVYKEQITSSEALKKRYQGMLARLEEKVWEMLLKGAEQGLVAPAAEPTKNAAKAFVKALSGTAWKVSRGKGKESEFEKPALYTQKSNLNQQKDVQW